MSLTCAPSSSLILDIVTALSSLFAAGCGGVGWDNNAHVTHVPVHTQAPQPHHLSCSRTDTGTALSWSVTSGVVVQTQALLFHDQLPVGWGGMGWGNNVHVPVHAQAQQAHHLSCCPAHTGTALSWSVTGGVGWGGVRWGGTITCSCSRADTGTALSWSVNPRAYTFGGSTNQDTDMMDTRAPRNAGSRNGWLRWTFFN